VEKLYDGYKVRGGSAEDRTLYTFRKIAPGMGAPPCAFGLWADAPSPDGLCLLGLVREIPAEGTAFAYEVRLPYSATVERAAVPEEAAEVLRWMAHYGTIIPGAPEYRAQYDPQGYGGNVRVWRMDGMSPRLVGRWQQAERAGRSEYRVSTNGSATYTRDVRQALALLEAEATRQAEAAERALDDSEAAIHSRLP
jgi:hypothetical protein